MTSLASFRMATQQSVNSTGVAICEHARQTPKLYQYRARRCERFAHTCCRFQTCHTIPASLLTVSSALFQEALLEELDDDGESGSWSESEGNSKGDDDEWGQFDAEGDEASELADLYTGLMQTRYTEPREKQHRSTSHRYNLFEQTPKAFRQSVRVDAATFDYLLSLIVDDPTFTMTARIPRPTSRSSADNLAFLGGGHASVCFCYQTTTQRASNGSSLPHDEVWRQTWSDLPKELIWPSVIYEHQSSSDLGLSSDAYCLTSPC